MFLYVDLWMYYCENYNLVRVTRLDLHEFLKLKGFDLFKFFFDL
jgi:hypothetical protein